MNVSTRQQVLGFVFWLAVSVVVAVVGGVASVQAGDFYEGLVRPSWAPPAAVFGPVWTLLYVLMAVAAWLVWRVGGFRAAQGALALFLVQMVFNGLWSWLFFAWHQGALAFADIVLLCGLVLVTAVQFWRVRPLAGALLLPYLAWILFAAALNYSVWQLNPAVLA